MNVGKLFSSPTLWNPAPSRWSLAEPVFPRFSRSAFSPPAGAGASAFTQIIYTFKITLSTTVDEPFYGVVVVVVDVVQRANSTRSNCLYPVFWRITVVSSMASLRGFEALPDLDWLSIRLLPENEGTPSRYHKNLLQPT